jgi:CheY-like chemotaxis protein
MTTWEDYNTFGKTVNSGWVDKVMVSTVRPFFGKFRQKVNNNYNYNYTGAEKSGSLYHTYMLEVCGMLKMKILHLFYWNKFTHIYPVVSADTRQHRPPKELNPDQNYHIQDALVPISSNRVFKRQANTDRPAKETLANVLLVDDDRDILFTFKSILEAEGYHVEAFTDPNEALSHFLQMDQSYYNLVLTDIRMPNFNGFQLYEKLKELNTDIRILFMTAYDVSGNLPDKMTKIKDSDIIKKPIEEEHFVNLVKKALAPE